MNFSKEWKTFNSFIEVSEDGEIKSHGKMIKGEITRNGYIRIHVSNCGHSERYLVHRIVAEVFLPNPQRFPVVNHIDGNKQNNRVSNLEWCSYSKNLIHAYKNKLRSCDGEKNHRAKLTEIEVKEIRSTYIKGKHCENNAYQLAKRYDVSPKTILNIVKHESWKCC